jgi:hypothetical protein
MHRHAPFLVVIGDIGLGRGPGTTWHTRMAKRSNGER